MTQEELNKAFEGRWRIKGKYIDQGILLVDKSPAEYIKNLCRDFFETGVLLGEGVIRPPQNIELKHNVFADISFEQWWILYDKKRGKEKCFQKWKKLTPEEMGDCLIATPAYVASTPDKQYRKDPLTYLNGKCWNDEIIKKNGNKPTSDRDKLAEILTP